MELFKLERILKGCIVQFSYNEQGHLYIDQSPVQPNHECLWNPYKYY